MSVKEDERMILYPKKLAKLNYKKIKYHNKSVKELYKCTDSIN